MATKLDPSIPPILNTFESALSQRHSESRLRSLKTTPQSVVDFSSNDFLSLSKNSSHYAAFLAEISSGHANVNQQLGSTGSRLLDGNSSYAEALEQTIAAFHNAPACLLFNSGFTANLSFFACVPQPGDVVIYDELIHASVHDGLRLSRAATKLAFEHNSVRHLEDLLRRQLVQDEKLQNGERNVFIAVESVYSMEGDRAPLREITDTIERHFPKKNGYLIVDEAHATGVIGWQGRGLVCEAGLEHKVFARLHTFGKSLACDGACILSSPLTVQYLINYARPMIYTTFMSTFSLAAIKIGYDFLQSEKIAVLIKHIFGLIYYLRDNLTLLGIPTRSSSAHSSTDRYSVTTPSPPLLSLPASPTHLTTPIVSILTPFARCLAQHCQRQGFMVRAIMPPTVPQGEERIRICLHAGNTKEEVQALIESIRQWALHRKCLKPEDIGDGNSHDDPMAQAQTQLCQSSKLKSLL